MSPSKESTLPQKEKQQFHKLVKCYEQKQFKQGLKHAKSILSNPKCVEHGETLSMKGLILSAMNRKEEALDLARRGLRNDFSSGTCWHVYGLILRAEKKYDEAIKAYTNALKYEKTNQLILKDLSHLQIQMRDLEGFKKSRLEMLSLRPTLRASWIGYAISNHLQNEPETAFAILEEFSSTNKKTEVTSTKKDIEHDYESSELILYQSKILNENGKKEEARRQLVDNEKAILDKVSYMESLSQICLDIGNFADAERYLTTLIHRNPEVRDYYEKLSICVGADKDEGRLIEFYDTMVQAFPRAKLPRVLPLEKLSGEIFNKRLRLYMKDSLRKCLPNIFVTLKPIYSDEAKLTELGKVSHEFLSKLEESGIMDDGDELESPGSLVWLYHFLAQHYDFLGDHVKALKYVDEGLAHTPTLIELYVAKGRIYKHAGHIDYGVACLDEAQSLDTADRYLNCKCCRYLIRAGKIDKAETMAAQFTRENTTVQENLKEMQVLWFQIECAQTYFRQGKYGLALRKCYEIENVFGDITEDQFDFHQYCMRKMTLSKYVDMIRLEDTLREHRFFRCAAVIAIEIYIQIYDGVWNPETGKSSDGENQLSESELKKLKNKRKKQNAIKKQLEDKKKKDTNKKTNEPIKEDPLEPEKLIQEASTKSIEKAKEWTKWLEELSPEWLRGQVLSYQVARRRRRWLQALRCLKNCITYHGSNHPKVHPLICDWISLSKTAIDESENDIVKQILTEETEQIVKINKLEDPLELNKQFLNQNLNSYAHRLSAAQVEFHQKGEKPVDEIILSGPFNRTGTIEDYEDGLILLKRAKKNSDFLLKEANTDYPYAVAFGALNDDPPRMLKEFDQSQVVNGDQKDPKKSEK